MSKGCLTTMTSTPSFDTCESIGTYARGSTRAPGWKTRPRVGVPLFGVMRMWAAVSVTRTPAPPVGEATAAGVAA